MHKRKVLLLVLCAVFMGFVFGSVFAQEAQGNTRRSRCESAPPSPAQKRCNEFTFDAMGSYEPNNKKISHEWDFGDGATSDKPVVTHKYAKSGEYLVTLKVNNMTGVTCETSTTTQLVKANISPHSRIYGPGQYLR